MTDKLFEAAARASATLDREAAWKMPAQRTRFHGDGRPPEVVSNVTDLRYPTDPPPAFVAAYSHALSKRESLRFASNMAAGLAANFYAKGDRDGAGDSFAYFADLMAEAADTLEAIGKLTGDVQEPVTWSVVESGGRHHITLGEAKDYLANHGGGVTFTDDHGLSCQP